VRVIIFGQPTVCRRSASSTEPDTQVEEIVALTITALEGMIGRFTVDVRNAVYGDQIPQGRPVTCRSATRSGRTMKGTRT
jgi:hypothetical protein